MQIVGVQSFCYICRFHNPNALFCLRDPTFIRNLPANHLSRFVDKEPLNRYHLMVSANPKHLVRYFKYF